LINLQTISNCYILTSRRAHKVSLRRGQKHLKQKNILPIQGTIARTRRNRILKKDKGLKQ